MKPEDATTATVLSKLRSGESISDKELVVAIEVLEPIVEFLKACGDIFYLPCKFLHSKLEQLKNYRDARKIK
jgi:hypothetical protein